MIWRAWRYRLRLDPAEIAFVRRHLQPGDTAIDIGAHKGAYTWWMARAVGPGGRVISFEPQPALAERLAGLAAGAALRRALRPVEVHPIAISDVQGRAILHIDGPTPTPGATLGEPNADDRTDDGAHRHLVKTTTLDAWLAEDAGPPPSLIKIDVEGHESAVFAGAEKTLREHRPALLFECERRHHGGDSIAPIFERLHEVGYTGWFARQRRWFPIDEFEPDRDQVAGRRPYVNNFLFL